MRSKRNSGYIEILKLAGLAASSSLLGVVILTVPQTKGTKVGAQKTTAKKIAPVKTATGDLLQADLSPFVNKYCASCHGKTSQVAGLSLTKYKSLAEAKAAAEIWQRAASNVSNSHMPPKGMKMPTTAERQKFVDAVKRLVNEDCGVTSPGRVTLRRLNRAEYNNTIRDLIGVDYRPADDFPSDDVGYGFDNIGDVLSLSPLLMEKYLDAAEQIANRAISTEKRAPILVPGSNMTGKGAVTIDDDSADLASFGTAIASFNIARPGRYSISISGYQYKAGPDNAKVAVDVDGTAVSEFTIAETREKAGTFSLPFKFAKGKHTVGITFLNDFFDAKLPANQRDRNVTIKSVTLSLLDAAPFPESHLRLIPEPPEPGKERAAAEKTLRDLSTRAYRRPATQEEVSALLKLYDLTAQAKEPYEKRIQICLQAVLVSPHFLFKVETDKPGAKGDRALTDFELATRLSYFLWSSTPDSRLLQLAGEKKLGTPATLKAEVLRMLQDPKAQGLADNFAEQWLQLRRLENFQPNPEQFPGVDTEMKHLMANETKSFFMHVLNQNLPVTDFLDGKYTYLNARLAKHYGIPNITGDDLRLVNLAGTQRGGVLSQASILSITSNPTRTSPVKRGKWVLENILGTPPPPPPPDVGDLGDDGQILTSANLRERLEQHRKKPDCFSCHSRMDPIGFGMENYDAVGRWRTEDQNNKIDSSGVLPDGRKFTGPDQLKKILLQNKDQFTRTLADRLLTYATGRGMEPKDQCHLDEIVLTAKNTNYRFASMIIAITQSDPFRKRSANP
jgi:mono/diheme cytochrome c family protein